MNIDYHSPISACKLAEKESMVFKLENKQSKAQI